MRKILLAIVALTQMSIATERLPNSSQLIGIAHIDAYPANYGYFVLRPGIDKWYTGYGFHNIGVNRSDPSGGRDKFESATLGCNQHYLPSKQLMPRTLTDDIRQAILDGDLFHTYLEEENFLSALTLCLPDEQGKIWKRRLIAKAKDKIETYAMRGVLRDNARLKMKAVEIVNSFQDTPVHEELFNHYTQIVSEAEADLTRLFANPAVEALQPEIKKAFANQLFGDL